MLQGLYHTPLSIDVHMVSLGRRDVYLGLWWCLVPLEVRTPRTIQSRPNLPSPLAESLRPPGAESGTVGHMPAWEPWGTAPSLASGLWMWGVGRSGWKL